MARMKHVTGNIYPTNRDGNVELISKKGSVATIKFLNTGFVREVGMGNLMAGKAMDYTVTEREYTEVEYPNTLMSSNNYGSFILLEKKGKDCIVQFVETGYTVKALWENIKLGKIADPYKKNNYGGWQGEFEKTSYWKQADQLWRNMTKRCYSTKDEKGYLSKDVTVDDRWLCFANFLEDLPKLENFDLWLEGQKDAATKYNLDKDFKIDGNKVYSREACMFLTEAFNKSYTIRNRKVGKV